MLSGKALISLIKKILLDKDYSKIENISLQKIKNLISHYQIVDNTEEKNEFIKINIFLKKIKYTIFFYQNNIKYSDIVGKNFKNTSSCFN